jgi:hypothetical protein
MMALHTRDVHAVVIANRDVETLRPLTERTCAALLPVAGKPLLEHTLESLVLAGVRSGSVVVGPHAEQVERFLGTGERWGLALDMVLTRGDETEDEILSRLAIGRAEPLLAIRADRLRSPVVDTVLAADASGPGTGRWVSMGGVPAGVALITDASALRRGDVSSPPAAPGWEQRGDRIEIAGAFHPVDSVAGYHRANLSAVSGDVPGLILPGRRRGDGAVVGRQSTVPAAAVTGAPVFAGSRCLVHQGVELAAGTVLSDDVVVDRNATLIRTVVLPGTYVGESVELADAVVWSDVVVRVDTGGTARIADDFLLARLAPAKRPGLVGHLAHGALGALLLVASAPLWPAMAAASLLACPRAPFRLTTLRGNRRRSREFRALEPATAVPLLRGLPLMLSVLTGHLRLVGIQPLAPPDDDARAHEWSLEPGTAPAGLLGPAQLELAEDATPQERRIADIYYARTRTALEDLRWVLRGVRALFTRGAWSPRPTEAHS